MNLLRYDVSLIFFKRGVLQVSYGALHAYAVNSNVVTPSSCHVSDPVQEPDDEL